MAIPLGALGKLLKEPVLEDSLRREFGGTRQVGSDGSVYSTVGDRPIPPPKAMRLMHANRQEEIRQREEDREADETMKKFAMQIKDGLLKMNSATEKTMEDIRQRRELAQRDLDANLVEAAYEYDISGAGLLECSGCFTYSEASCRGAPVYQNASGWTLHRDRPPVESTIGTDEAVTEVGWLISKEGRPFYAVKTEALMVPAKGWQCFLGPAPPPTFVEPISWEEHFFEVCGPLKEAGNTALQQGDPAVAEEQYTLALEELAGYESVICEREELRALLVALHANRAEVRLRRKQYEKAADDCRRTLDLQPLHPKAVFRFCRACQALGRSSDAVPVLRTALKAAKGPTVGVLQGCLDTSEVLAGCEEGTSELTELYRALSTAETLNVKMESGVYETTQYIKQATDTLLAQLQRFKATPANSKLAKDLAVLMQGTNAVQNIDGLYLQAQVLKQPWCDDEVYDKADLGKNSFTGQHAMTLGACVPAWMGEPVVRSVMQGLEASAEHLLNAPLALCELLRALLRHPLSTQLQIADSIMDIRGFAADALHRFGYCLQMKDGAVASEVLQALAAQCTRVDNVEALGLGLFVEGFVGPIRNKQDGTETFSGGFSMYPTLHAKEVVLALLRRWSDDPRMLASFTPELMGRVWVPAALKLNRDVGAEMERPVPMAGKNALKLQWFKLRRPQHLGKLFFHAEELLEAFLQLLRAHLRSTCSLRAAGKVQQGALMPRHPAEEWLDEALDRPFGWGILLPLLVAPPPLSVGALVLLEDLVDRYPHQEQLANTLAGLHVFMPLLGLPWPSASKCAQSHMAATLALGEGPRSAAAKLLRCTIDTEFAIRVAELHLETSLNASLNLLESLVNCESRPDGIIAAGEVVGILTSNLNCWHMVPQKSFTAIIRTLAKSANVEVRLQMSKLLRHAQRDSTVAPRLQMALNQQEETIFEEHQQRALMAEILDRRTPAGQRQAEIVTEMTRRLEQTPAPAAGPCGGRCPDFDNLCAAIHRTYLQHLKPARILVLGRRARALCSVLVELRPQPLALLVELTLPLPEDLVPSARTILLPARVELLASDALLAGCEKLDLLLLTEPIGFCAVGEVADILRPFIRRRECDEEKKQDQVQCMCLELQERLEEARDELFVGGYYDADHDAGLQVLRPLARKLGYGVALFGLPSEERERRKRVEAEKSEERTLKQRAKAEVDSKRFDEKERSREMLCRTLFPSWNQAIAAECDVQDRPYLNQPMSVSFAVGAEPGDADLLLIWLPTYLDRTCASRQLLEAICAASCGESAADDCVDIAPPRLRAVEACCRGETVAWHGWTDEEAVSYGAKWFEIAGGVTREDEEKAAQDRASNIAFPKAQFEELDGLQIMSDACRSLAKLLEELTSTLRPSAQLVLAGFSQGGAAAVYAALTGIVAPEVQSRIRAVIPCCTGIPGLTFLGPRLQEACLSLRGQAAEARLPNIYMVYGRDDSELQDSFVQVSYDLYRRFSYPVSLYRFRGSCPEDRFPLSVRVAVLTKIVRSLLL